MTTVVQTLTCFIIPRKAVRYILFQRTHYLLPKIRVVKFFYRALMNFFPKTTVLVLSYLFQTKIKSSYIEDMNSEFNICHKYLGLLDCKNILDIGCGIAGIDVLLYKGLLSNPSLFLLDKSEEKKIYYRFREEGAFYNSLNITKEVLISNGIPENKIYILEANNFRIPFSTDFDLIISLLSWGFHYPISTYLESVYSKMIEGGILIVDIRKGTNGIERLQEKFNNIEIIHETHSYLRIKAIK